MSMKNNKKGEKPKSKFAIAYAEAESEWANQSIKLEKTESSQTIYCDAEETQPIPNQFKTLRRRSTLQSAHVALEASKEAFLLTKLFFSVISWFGFGKI